jgi:hypothetical protein
MQLRKKKIKFPGPESESVRFFQQILLFLFVGNFFVVSSRRKFDFSLEIFFSNENSTTLKNKKIRKNHQVFDITKGRGERKPGENMK